MKHLKFIVSRIEQDKYICNKFFTHLIIIRSLFHPLGKNFFAKYSLKKISNKMPF